MRLDRSSLDDGFVSVRHEAEGDAGKATNHLHVEPLDVGRPADQDDGVDVFGGSLRVAQAFGQFFHALIESLAAQFFEGLAGDRDHELVNICEGREYELGL